MSKQPAELAALLANALGQRRLIALIAAGPPATGKSTTQQISFTTC